jgi:hypothetical protein
MKILCSNLLTVSQSVFIKVRVPIQRVITDKGPAFHSALFGETCLELGITRARDTSGLVALVQFLPLVDPMWQPQLRGELHPVAWRVAAPTPRVAFVSSASFISFPDIAAHTLWPKSRALHVE